MVIPWLSPTTQSGAILGATRRDGGGGDTVSAKQWVREPPLRPLPLHRAPHAPSRGRFFAHCCAGQSLHGITMPHSVRLALRKNDRRRRRDLSTDKL